MPKLFRVSLAAFAIFAFAGCESEPPDESETFEGVVRTESFPAEDFPVLDQDAHAEEIVADDHPSLLLTADRIAEIREREASDPLMARLLDYIRMNAESYLAEPLLEYSDNHAKQLQENRALLGRILTWGLIYHLDSDPRYANRAINELVNVASFPSWDPDKFLNVAEMSAGVGFGYDWFYDEMTDSQRELVHRALMEKSLEYAPAAYGQRPAEKTPNWSAVSDIDTAINNWNQVCNGGLLVAAFALREEEPEMMELVVEGARKSLPRAMVNFGPDGVWPESPTYMGYATLYNSLAIALLKDQLGTDFGLSQMEGFDESIRYLQTIFGPTGVAFTYGDGGPAKENNMGSTSSAGWFLTEFDQRDAVPQFRRRLDAFFETKMGPYESSLTPGAANRMKPLLALWLPAAVNEETVERPPLDSHQRGIAELVFLRSAWNDPEAVWLAMKAGENGFAHGHLDLGSFVFEADGVRWGEDIGSGKYGLPGYWRGEPGGQRWAYFRTQNLSHNTISPGDELQSVSAVAPVIDFKSAPTFAYAIVDLTEVYPGTADRMLRGVAILDRARVLTQDEWKGQVGREPMVWRMVTQAEITLSSDRKTAMLSRHGKKLTVRICEPNQAVFSIDSAAPPTSSEKQNREYRILRATVPATTEDTRLAILLSPGAEPPLSVSIIPVSEWSTVEAGGSDASQ